MTRFTRGISSTFAVLLVTGILSVPAAAQTTVPQPGCNDFALTDPVGDVASPTMDIKGIWFDHAAGGKVFAFMRVANLARTVPTDSSFINWRIQFTSAAGSFRVFAYVRKDGANEFRFAKLEPTSASYVPSPDPITGTFFDGPDGVIRWELPASTLGAPGTAIRDSVGASQDFIAGHPLAGGLVTGTRSDSMTGLGTAYLIGQCPPPPAPPPSYPQPSDQPVDDSQDQRSDQEPTYSNPGYAPPEGQPAYVPPSPGPPSATTQAPATTKKKSTRKKCKKGFVKRGKRCVKKKRKRSRRT